ncbi:MAG: methyltransferase [Verrucomicrobia bacterium]|nr:methyltransferase [Verrucomicrobiota bacterium]
MKDGAQTVEDPFVAEMHVDEVTYPGKAVGRVDGLVTFVPGALEGEHVRIQERHRHKRYRDASVLEVIAPSPHRIVPLCPVAHVCPGCRYQHTTYAHELQMKSTQFASLLKRMAHIQPAQILAPVASPRSLGYRNKIVLHSVLVGDVLQVGYYGEDNTSIIVLDDGCPLAVDEINKTLAELHDTGQMRLHENEPITLRFTETDGVVHWRGAGETKSPWLTEKWRFGELFVPRGAFFQINRDIGNALVDAFVEMVTAAKPEMVVDLFCGVGVFALAAAECGVPHVLGIDVDLDAIKAARQNAQLMAQMNTTFVAQSARSAAKEAMMPMKKKTGLLIVDPPRDGLHKSVAQEICASGPRNLVYISCGPDTFCRDLKLLAEAGYQLASTQIFDMFPRTPHFEVLAYLTR